MMIISACSLVTGGSKVALDGEWRLSAGTDHGQPIPIVAAGKITLQVKGAQLGGTAACNSYGGKIVVNGSAITIGELIQTEMACLDDRLMASEAAYLAALPQVTKAARNGATLVLTGPQVELRYTLVPAVPNADLVGTAWVLDSLISGETVSSTIGGPLSLAFTPAGVISGSTGCRDFSGHFTIDGSDVKVTLDPYDLIACAGQLGDQDTHILAVISNGFSFAIDGSTLTLTAGGKGLGYRAA